MRWPEDAEGWPHAEASRIVESRPHRWHVQEAGEGETLLLIHGAGGATQSWRGLLPILARSHRVIAVDLPGQGFTALGTRMRCGLDAMAEDLAALMRAEGWAPAALVGHSAGVAIALRMAEGMDPAPPVIGFNAALDNFEGVAGWLFPVMAKLLAATPLTATLFASTATPSSVRRLIEGTGSRLDAEGLALYGRLAADRGHVDATLSMMSQWSLNPLVSRLPGHPSRTLLVAGDRDRAVPPGVSRRSAERMPEAASRLVPGLGHLLHEEAPETAAEAILGHLAA